MVWYERTLGSFIPQSGRGLKIVVQRPKVIEAPKSGTDSSSTCMSGTNSIIKSMRQADESACIH